jgi:DNA-directed RNA polymerase subunit K/omega
MSVKDDHYSFNGADEEDEIEEESEEEEEEDDDQDEGLPDDDDEDEIDQVDDDDDQDDDGSDENESVDSHSGGAKKKAVQVKEKSLKTASSIEDNVADSEDDDDDDEDDENYLQKFDQQLKQSYVQNFHPECNVHNYQEISALSKVVRDKNNIIIDPLHRTIPFLTKYERARVLGQRAKQINSGAKPFIKVPENVIDGAVIAELELAQKRIPFIIRRPFPGGSGCEYWNLKDLEILV